MTKTKTKIKAKAEQKSLKVVYTRSELTHWDNMGSIQILDGHVINQIAAGEVVERPASVVRELVDNAVDVGAADISIFLHDGGHSLIRVVDDGSGMDEHDAKLAFERHATSKISKSEDLFAIQTLGFRGEALPSIAAVSRVCLITRTDCGTGSNTLGTKLILEGGKRKVCESTSCAQGCDIQVSTLFFNTPARRKFLKSQRAEELRVKEWLVQYALLYPSIRFRLYFDGREVLNLAAKDSLIARAHSTWRGSGVAVSKKQGEFELHGLLLHPAQAGTDSKNLVLSVNGRLVHDRMVLRAVKDGFGSTLREREYPVGVVSLRLPPSEVDVNVHPQKSEVRFRSGQAVFGAVRSAVAEAVLEFRAPQSPQQIVRSISEYSPGVQRQSPLQQATLDPCVFSTCSISQAVQEEFRFSRLRYVGQLFECYLIAQDRGLLVMVDMHAAHERCNYNLIRNSLTKAIRTKERMFMVQQLLLPAEVLLSEREYFNLSEQQLLLEWLGFEFTLTPPNMIILRGVPAILAGASGEGMVREIAEIDGDQGADALGSIERKIDHIAARLACHASIRSGKVLTDREVYALFELLDSTEYSAACPHGRPVVVSFSLMQVERWFGRDQ